MVPIRAWGVEERKNRGLKAMQYSIRRPLILTAGFCFPVPRRPRWRASGLMLPRDARLASPDTTMIRDALTCENSGNRAATSRISARTAWLKFGRRVATNDTSLLESGRYRH